MKLLPLVLMFFLMSIGFVAAAQIHGTVYGSSLNKIQNVILKIDSDPAQVLFSRTGEYSFEVNPGRNYTIQARINNTLIAQESLAVSEEGSFVIDLFSFPDFTNDEKLLAQVEEQNVDESLFNSSPTNWSLVIFTIILVIIGISVYKKMKEKSENQSKENVKEMIQVKTDLEGLLEIIKKEGGRITQKELRRHFLLSEAKVSLMIAELESKGKIEKIKKGRGNIIVVK